MIERYIHRVRVDRPPPSEAALEARERLRDKFPRTALRRMTHLGMLIGSSLDDVTIQAGDAMVYASTFAETRALEDFLSSFPSASPMLFQTSIHPGGVQQVLIGRQQPVARLWPLAGGERLVEHTLLTALLEPADRVIVVGGEERGTWLLERGVASDRAFAFALVLTAESAGSLGSIRVETVASAETEPSSGDDPLAGARGYDSGARPLGHDAGCPSLCSFADALAEKRPLTWEGGGRGWTLAWS